MDRKITEKQVRGGPPFGAFFLTRLLAFIPLFAAGCATIPLPPPDGSAAGTAPAAAAGETAKGGSPSRPPISPSEGKTAVVAAATETGATAPEAAQTPPASAPPADIWARIRAGFRLPKLQSPLVERHERWFADNPEYMRAMMERARLYLYYIVEEVEKRGMPTEIALLPAIESAYKPYAYSRARAAGLWQFIPSTGRLYGLKMNWWYDGRRDVIASTQAALDYLEKLYSDFDGDWFLALAAYNAGEGRVMRAMEYNRRHGRPTDFEHLTQLKWETRNYVPKLMAMVNIVSDPARYGIELAAIPNEPYFARVDIDSQIDLGVVARLMDMSIEELTLINPGLNRWATDPDGPHHLLVPVDKKDELIEGLNNLPEEERLQWRRHVVVRGETLYELAARYGVTVEAIRRANALRSNLVRAGQSLLIPVSARPLKPAVIAARRANALPRSAGRAAAAAGEPIIHRVRRGETLWGIAQRYGVLIRQIVEWNLLDPNDVLRHGQRLKIWPNRGPSAAIAGDTPSG
jgi:membrane-bound lytic murein transglycosylase D